jgi:hypothetical protein
MFNKVCRNRRCGKFFTSESRNTQFCCDACKKAYNKDKLYSAGRKEKTDCRKLARQILLASGRKQVCAFPGCNTTVGLMAHHKNGIASFEETYLENLDWMCVDCHCLIHHNARYNRWQLTQTGYIKPVKLFCKVIGKQVFCTTLQCSSKLHCVGVETLDELLNKKT